MDFANWRDETFSALTSMAEGLGWTHERSMAQTGTWYITLDRVVDTVDQDGDDYQEWDRFTVRIADHGSCYERESFSLDFCGGGHTIEQVREMLLSAPGSIGVL